MRVRTLLVVDGSEGSAGVVLRAARLAERYRAELVLAAPKRDGALRSSFDVAETRAALLRARGVAVRVHQLHALRCDDITAEATRSCADLVVKAIDRRPMWTRLAGEDVDRRLVRECPRALWLVRPSQGPRAGVVLAAINPQDGDAPGAALDSDVLRAAAYIADGLGMQLHVAHAWRAWVMPLLGRVAVDIPRELATVGEERRAALWRVRETIARGRVPVPDSRIHLARVDARSALIHLAHALRIDTLVMGRVVRRGLPRLFIGNLAERILSHVPCSLVVVHRTPVTVEARSDGVIAISRKLADAQGG